MTKPEKNPKMQNERIFHSCVVIHSSFVIRH
jgi:hypothetical protein